MRVLTSVVERDAPAIGVRYAEGATLQEPFACALRAAGLDIVDQRAATAAHVDALGSSWAKRLGIPARRPAWLLTARRLSF